MNLKNLRISDLELFITAAHLKKLSKAAEFHHLSQSAASSAIQRVEAAFGMPLCTHEKRKFSLTIEGQELIARAEIWLKELQDLALGTRSTPIRIVTTHAIAQGCVRPLLTNEKIELQLMRPDSAYAAILQGRADIALVLDNAPWQALEAQEIAKGYFQLYSRKKSVPKQSVLIPEDQIEVLALKQRWQQLYEKPLVVKAVLPSWSLIADICTASDFVGFLPDFLAARRKLYPVKWQPQGSAYRLLALYKSPSASFQKKLKTVLALWKKEYQL